MLVQPGLCRTCSETTLLVFPRGGSNEGSTARWGRGNSFHLQNWVLGNYLQMFLFQIEKRNQYIGIHPWQTVGPYRAHKEFDSGENKVADPG